VGDPGYFGHDSATWKIASEAVLTVGGARAVLMQLAHPLVAMGVSAHSSYMSDPLKRTENTFILGQMLTFGPTRTAHEAARTINQLHKHVHGTLPLDAGDYKHGATYDARDPELLLWVHATLIDTILQVYPLLVRPLSNEEQDHYYQESKMLARLLGLSADAMPETAQDLQHYVHDMVYSGRLAATPQARQLARVVLFPPLPRVLQPLMFLNLQITSALLPEPVREIYGMEWSDLRQRAFDLSAAGVRTILPHMPQYMRLFPITRRLMKQAA
jgi:uncharacterized protein (DUF2236 family)